MTDQQQEELKQLILSDKSAYFAKLREEVGDNPKALKAIAIVENIMRLADLTVEGVKLRSRKKKRIFSNRNRKTKKLIKKEKAKNVLVNAMQQRMQLAQLHAIKATPIRLDKGSNQSEGVAWVGERGKEVVINKEGAIMHFPGAYQTDSFIPMVHDYEKRLDHSQMGNYPYPVDQSTCDHIYGTKSDINNNWNGSMKAVCMKCGFEP